MYYPNKIKTSEDPIVQKDISDLIELGYAMDLLVDSGVVQGKTKYFLFIKYRNIVLPVYTQRKVPKTFVDIVRAIKWAKNLGMDHVYINVNCDDIS